MAEATDRDDAAKQAAQPKADEAQRRRAKEAWNKRDRWNQLFLSIYEYVAPHRLSTRLYQQSPGNRTDNIFDPHATNALHRTAGRLQQDIFPAGEPFVVLEPGPAVAEENEDDVRKELQAKSDVANACFHFGDFDNAVNGMIVDGLISTGFLLMLEGDARQPVRFVNVPLDEMAVDLGPYDEIEGFFWKRKWTRRAIFEAFPKGSYDDAFKGDLAAKGEEEITLCQDTVYDRRVEKWRLCVHLDGDDAADIWTETFETCPWAAFRYFRLPGEPYGFGPVAMNLPLIKTLNKVAELALKGAALNLMGIFTRIDDGVFNPDTARVQPGAFWTVARNGGPLGPSIQRLQGGTDPNLAMMPTEDLRLSISAGMMDQQLPPDGQSPRSAAEILERAKRLSQDHAGAFGRIVHDVYLAIYPRVMEILHKRGVLKGGRVTIDQLYVKAKIVSPLGRAFMAKRAQTTVEWLQLAGALAPDAMPIVTPVERTLAQVGHDMGVPADRIHTDSEQQAMARTIAQQVQAALAAQARQGQAPPPANGDPAQAMAA